MLHDAVELRMASKLDPATLRREVVGADGLIIRTGGVVDAALLDCGDQLRVVGRHGVGYDQIDIEAATARGIQVVYTPGANTQSVAEHVFALMIGLSRHFPRMMSELNAGNYLVRTTMKGREIAGKSLGIIGFGRIGRRVGEIANLGFDMKVLYHDIVPAPSEVEQRANARRVDLREVLETCEYVTLHVPLDKTTRAMINRETLALDAQRCHLDQHVSRARRRRAGRRRGPRRRAALGLWGRRFHRRAATPRPPSDWPVRRDAHAPQCGANRRRPANDGGHDRAGGRRRASRAGCRRIR